MYCNLVQFQMLFIFFFVIFEAVSGVHIRQPTLFCGSWNQHTIFTHLRWFFTFLFAQTIFSQSCTFYTNIFALVLIAQQFNLQKKIIKIRTFRWIDFAIWYVLGNILYPLVQLVRHMQILFSKGIFVQSILFATYILVVCCPKPNFDQPSIQRIM